jgi:hypothetical protein
MQQCLPEPEAQGYERRAERRMVWDVDNTPLAARFDLLAMLQFWWLVGLNDAVQWMTASHALVYPNRSQP